MKYVLFHLLLIVLLSKKIHSSKCSVRRSKTYIISHMPEIQHVFNDEERIPSK